MRDRLIELLDKKIEYSIAADEREDEFKSVETDKLADYLLENGVIVPPCKVADVVYYLRYEYSGKMIPIPCTVDSIVYDGRWLRIYGIEERQNTQMWYADDFGKTVFLTKEEAEQALKGGAE